MPFWSFLKRLMLYSPLAQNNYLIAYRSTRFGCTLELAEACLLRSSIRGEGQLKRPILAGQLPILSRLRKDTELRITGDFMTI